MRPPLAPDWRELWLHRWNACVPQHAQLLSRASKSRSVSGKLCLRDHLSKTTILPLFYHNYSILSFVSWSSATSTVFSCKSLFWFLLIAHKKNSSNRLHRMGVPLNDEECFLYFLFFLSPIIFHDDSVLQACFLWSCSFAVLLFFLLVLLLLLLLLPCLFLILFHPFCLAIDITVSFLPFSKAGSSTCLFNTFFFGGGGVFVKLVFRYSMRVQLDQNVTSFEQLFLPYQMVLVVWNTFRANFKSSFISSVKQNWHFCGNGGKICPPPFWATFGGNVGPGKILSPVTGSVGLHESPLSTLSPYHLYSFSGVRHICHDNDGWY